MNNFAENKNIYIYKHVKKTKHMAISHLRVNNRETPRQIDAGSMQSTYCYCTYFSEETHIYWLILHKLMNCPENKLCLSFFMSIVNAVSKNTIGLRCCLFFFLIPENFFVCIHQTKKKKNIERFFLCFIQQKVQVEFLCTLMAGKLMFSFLWILWTHHSSIKFYKPRPQAVCISKKILCQSPGFVKEHSLNVKHSLSASLPRLSRSWQYLACLDLVVYVTDKDPVPPHRCNRPSPG